MDKLYITPKQWLHILRWTLYILLLVFAALLQTVVFGTRTVFGVHPELVPVVITCVCLREGPERGGTYALIGSLLWCLSGTDLGSVSIVLLTVVPVLASLLCRSVLANNFFSCLAVTFLVLSLHQTATFLIKAFYAAAQGSLFFTKVIPCVLVSLLVQPLIYFPVKWIETIGDAYEST